MTAKTAPGPATTIRSTRRLQEWEVDRLAIIERERFAVAKEAIAAHLKAVDALNDARMGQSVTEEVLAMIHAAEGMTG